MVPAGGRQLRAVACEERAARLWNPATGTVPAVDPVYHRALDRWYPSGS
jgi:hypothetical protein